MTAAGAAGSGRVAAERLMLDTCTVTRVTGQTLSESLGVLTATSTTVYTGACRVKPEPTDSQTAAGDRATMERRYVVSLPITATTVAVDDVVTVTASDLDAGLVGAVMVVAGQAKGSQITARRLACVEVTN